MSPHRSDSTLSGGSQQPLVGLAGRFGAVGHVRRLKTDGWMPAKCSMFTAFTGNPTALTGSYRRDHQGTFGTGRAYDDPARARLLAVSESLERLASGVVDEDALTVASADDLGDDAMDLAEVPRCSPSELRRPECPLREPDRTAPIRWATAVDLRSGADVFVPAVMVSLGLDRQPAESFWIQISTGAAAHTTVPAATLNAICEVIERDALAVTWLQRLPLPRLADTCVPAAAREIIEWCDERGVDTHLFDATTDVGVPTVYCLQTTRDPQVDRAAQLVGGATDFDVSGAVLRAVLEAAGMRSIAYSAPRLPRSYAGYSSVSDGAAVMGRRSRRPLFGFLLDNLGDRAVSCPRSPVAGSDGQRLAWVIQRLAELDMPVYAVDISTRELDDAGHAAVYVTIPALQPMSLLPLAQYRAHPRLYRAPAAMGLPVLPERGLNPYPQPMA